MMINAGEENVMNQKDKQKVAKDIIALVAKYQVHMELKFGKDKEREVKKAVFYFDLACNDIKRKINEKFLQELEKK